MLTLAELPKKIRNVLRSTPDPYSRVPSLRQTISAAHFPGLLAWLAKYGARSAPFYFGRKPKTISALRGERRILTSLPLQDELSWAVANFEQYAPMLQGFLAARQAFSDLLLAGRYEEIIDQLDQMEASFGISFWSIENRIAVLQLANGLESQKAFLAHIRKDSRSSTVEFMAYFISERNEETTNPERFRRHLIKSLPEWTESEEFVEYALFRLADHWSLSAHTLSTILRWEYNSSVIDHYETFIRLAARLVCEQPGTLAQFSSAVERLNEFIDDHRLKKIAFINSGATHWLNSLTACETSALDSYYMGQLKKALVMGTHPGHLSLTESLFAIVMAASDAALAEVPTTDRPLRDRISELLFHIATKRGNYNDAYSDILRLATNLQANHYAASVTYLAKTLMQAEIRPDVPLGRKAAIEGHGLSPALIQFLPPHQRLEFASIIRTRGGSGISLEAEVYRGNGDADQTLINALSPAVKLEVYLDAAWSRGDWSTVISLGETVSTDSSPRHQRHVWRIMAWAFIRQSNTAKVTEYIASRCIRDPECAVQMPLRACVETLSEDILREIAGSLSTPIILDLFSRHVEDRPTELRYAYEDFLAAHGLSRPSATTSLLAIADRAQLIYFLRYVCVPRTMELSPVFENSRAVQNERIAVCSLLKEIDPTRQGIYDAEIREITRRQQISLGLREVEQSKIWIDQEPLRRWAERNLHDSFLRYKTLKLAGLGTPASHAVDSLQPIPASEPIKHLEVPELPADEAADLLQRMVSQFIYQCFFNKQHGLEIYLSLRIRHGVLSGHLRAPLEAAKIITLQREAGSGDYATNDYWMERLSALDPEMAIVADTRLQRFSREFDILVDAFSKDRIQISGEQHKQGLFIAGFVPAKLVLMASDIHADTTFDSFIDLCCSVFWDSIQESLEIVRQYIDNDVLEKVNALLVSLLRDMEAITYQYSTPELDNAIRNAQTNLRHALDQVKHWFQKPTTPTLMTFQQLVEVSLEIVKNMYHDFSPSVTFDVEELPLFFQLQKFTDIFIIIFGNIWRHCGIIDSRII